MDNPEEQFKKRPRTPIAQIISSQDEDGKKYMGAAFLKEPSSGEVVQMMYLLFRGFISLYEESNNFRLKTGLPIEMSSEEMEAKMLSCFINIIEGGLEMPKLTTYGINKDLL